MKEIKEIYDMKDKWLKRAVKHLDNSSRVAIKLLFKETMEQENKKCCEKCGKEMTISQGYKVCFGCFYKVKLESCHQPTPQTNWEEDKCAKAKGK